MSHPKIATAKGRILVIDDSEVVLEQARSELTAAGYEVVATSQTVGVSRHLGSMDLVIVDFHMPGFDGKYMVTSMRDAIGDKRPRCLLYLYTSDEEQQRNYKAHGFDGFFTDKGRPRTLAPQVDAVFRLLKMRGIAGKIRTALDH